jgi:hypothetical protein
MGVLVSRQLWGDVVQKLICGVVRGPVHSLYGHRLIGECNETLGCLPTRYCICVVLGSWLSSSLYLDTEVEDLLSLFTLCSAHLMTVCLQHICFQGPGLLFSGRRFYV